MRFYRAHINAKGEFEVFSDSIEMLSNLVRSVRTEFERLPQNQDYGGLATRQSLILCLGKCSSTVVTLIAHYYLLVQL